MRLSAVRSTFALSAATGALAFAAPAAAQDGTYEYAQPAPEEPVIYSSEPVVQPLPGHALPAPGAPVHSGPVHAIPGPPPPTETYAVEVVDVAAPPAPPLPPPPPYVAQAYPAPAYPATYAAPPVAYAGPAYGAPYPMHGYAHAAPPPPPPFDRMAWLDECHDRIRGVDRADRAGVIGGLLGATVGGVIGNRAWDSKRLAGTLLGAGIGGLAGVAIGAAVGAASDRRHEDECAFYLDRHLSAGYPAPGFGYQGYGYPGYGYGYGGYTLVPVMVAVPQRQVVRETVTEEWVDEPVHERTVTRTRVIHRPAPAPAGDKRIKLTKGH